MPDLGGVDKYARGTVLVLGGSVSTPGAVILAGIAALRMGAGRLKIATDEKVAAHVAVAVPEALVIGMPSSNAGLELPRELADQLAQVDVVVAGPGMIADEPPTRLLSELCDLIEEDSLVVVDALALAAFLELDERRRGRLAARAVMTPNRQELNRLAGRSDDDERGDAICVASHQTGAVLTSFGTVQAPDGRSWRTTVRSPGLGTSGSGDVLAGLVGGAAARTGDLLKAAMWATFAHMEAGRRLEEAVGTAAYLARELLPEIPRCLPRPSEPASTV